MAGSFGKPDISWNYSFKYLLPKVVTQVLGNLMGKISPLIKHGQQDTLDFKLRIQVAANADESVEQLRDPLESKVLTLNWNQKGSGCGQGVYRQEVKRWRTIQQT